jgi:hypothetical protein
MRVEVALHAAVDLHMRAAQSASTELSSATQSAPVARAKPT